MPTVPIGNVGQYGIIEDVFPHELPANAWSAGNNFRARNKFMEKFLGHLNQFGAPPIAPYNISPAIGLTGTYFWAVAGLVDVYAYDFTNYTKITRAASTYSATADNPWIISNFQGLPILNNGVDKPQVWTPVSSGQKLVDLPNWPANTTANAVRPFRAFLVAMDVTKTGTRDQYMVKWSHEASAGAVPSSWDPTDATKDAGEFDLADSVGAVVDGITQRTWFTIYKQDSVWAMAYVGGPVVMSFGKLFDGWGILSRRCAVEYVGGKHAVFGIGDIYVHDGQTPQSIVDERMKKWVFNQLNPMAYQRAFVTTNRFLNEVWFCFPSGSSLTCNVALVWNWAENTLSIRDLPSISGAIEGINVGTGSNTWNQATNTWNNTPGPWFSATYNPSKPRLLLASPANSKVYTADETNMFDGVAVSAYIERTGLGVPFRANQPPDMSSMKFLSAVWPRIEGTLGQVVQVQVGSQMNIQDNPTYQPAMNYTIGVSQQLPCTVAGRLFCFKFSSAIDVDWRLHGYDLDVKQIGRF